LQESIAVQGPSAQRGTLSVQEEKREEDAVEEYNRDEPQAGDASWTGLITGMAVGFLLGGSLCLIVAWIFLYTGPFIYAAILLFVTPVAAGCGGLIGMWLGRYSPKKPLS
jgi:hypothetical protein